MSRRKFSIMKPLRRALGAALLALLAGAAPFAHAGDHDHHRGNDRNTSSCKREQDCAREALLKGEIRPLTEVLKAVREKVPGDIIEIELDREDGIWVYEVKVLPPSGRRKKLEIDARTLEIMKID